MAIIRERRQHYITICLWVAMAAVLAGCSANPLAGLHQDGVESNPSVLTADGQAALSRGDYSNALKYFDLALQHDPKISEARVGYAEAALKVRQFDLSAFITNVVQNSKGSSSPTPQLVKPADWGCANAAAVIQLYTTMISTLDPICLGQTQGIYPSNDINVNLNAGLFYALRMAARAQDLSATFVVEELSKSSYTPATLGITQAQFDALPNTFWWITNATPAALAVIQAQLRTDIDAGVARMNTAAAGMSGKSRQSIDDLVNMFKSLQIQAYL